MRAGNALKSLKGANFDQDIGVKIVRDACKVPCKTICMNAGFEGSVVVEKLSNEKGNYGFDAALGEYVDMVKSGIIDPTKVVRTALVDASGVASLMITTEAMVVDLPKDDAPMGGSGGMGGMGGMGGATGAAGATGTASR